MNTILAFVILAGLLGGVLVLLQRNHERTAGPRSPYRDAWDPGDTDLRRTWLDLMAGRH
jgi:hypothetical protein